MAGDPVTGRRAEPRVVCAWCEKPMRGDPASPVVSHGLCLACASGMGAYPTEDLLALDASAYDALPLGIITLDAAGRVIAFNTQESRLSGLDPGEVLGRDFFQEIAPCTKVREFQGVYERLVASSGGTAPPFSFVFRFRGGDREVRINLRYDAARAQGQILVRTRSDAEAELED